MNLRPSSSTSDRGKVSAAVVSPRFPGLTAYQIRPGLPTRDSALYNIAMSAHGFADFLEQLQAQGRLLRKDAPIPRHEIGDQLADSGPIATLLTQVGDAPTPLILGVFSSFESILQAFRTSNFEEASVRVGELASGPKGGTWLERLGANRVAPTQRFQPKVVRTGPSQQIIRLGRDVDLRDLPLPLFFADEQFPALTAGRLLTKRPSDDRLHVGRYDFRVVDSNRLAACWAPSSEPAGLLTEYRRQGERMPVAVAFGGEPVDLLAAMAPLPPSVDVLEWTGGLRGAPCELVAGRSVGFPVPADAELVIEGTIDPSEPFVDPGSGLDEMGQPRPLRPGAVVQVEAVTHRPTPLFPALLPEEKGLIHRALGRIFLPWLRQELPALVDLEFPDFGGDRVWAFASIDPTYPGQASQFAHAFWGLTSMLPVRYLVIVGDRVDVHNPKEVWQAVATHAVPASDVRLADVPPDAFLRDPLPGRMVLDATRSCP